MAKTTPISGFPEWTPEQTFLQQHCIQIIAEQFELHGFVPLETRSVEPLSVLLSKGDDKEIYVLRRLHEPLADSSKNIQEQLGLHFDLTIPFARYVIEHQHALVFPFKRYQIQKSWRGERPQEGRYREFYQCDIDVIGAGELDVSQDAQMASTLLNTLAKLPIPPVELRLNNRKVLQGFYQALGITDLTQTLRIVDKLDKIGPEAVAALLIAELKLSETDTAQIIQLAQIKGTTDAIAQARALGASHPQFFEGLAELETVLALTNHPSIIVDFSIARGLDYYTGTVFEGRLIGHEQLGSVCSGGRYDNLAVGGRSPYPGVGASIGLTRLLGYLFGRELLAPLVRTPVQVMILLNDENSRMAAFEVAATLRQRNIATDVYHAPQAFKKQLKQIEKRGIAYALFMDEVQGCSVKALATGEQSPIDIATWQPEAVSVRWQSAW